VHLVSRRCLSALLWLGCEVDLYVTGILDNLIEGFFPVGTIAKNPMLLEVLVTDVGLQTQI
jgi:hypothetical protein